MRYEVLVNLYISMEIDMTTDEAERCLFEHLVAAINV